MEGEKNAWLATKINAHFETETVSELSCRRKSRTQSLSSKKEKRDGDMACGKIATDIF